MSDLIWIGNTLVPRGYVIVVAGTIIVTLIFGWSWLTRDRA